MMCFALTMPCESKIVKKGNQWVEVTDTTKTKTPDKAVGTYVKKGKKGEKDKTYTVYQGKRGGYYWVDEKGKRHYLPKQ